LALVHWVQWLHWLHWFPSSAWEPGLEAPLPEDAKQSFGAAFPSRAWERVNE